MGGSPVPYPVSLLVLGFRCYGYHPSIRDLVCLGQGPVPLGHTAMYGAALLRMGKRSEVEVQPAGTRTRGGFRPGTSLEYGRIYLCWYE